jgi:hypothetical protein
MTRKNERKAVGLCVFFVLGLAYLAHADPITIQISGEITLAGGSALPTGISLGDAFTGSYTYNSSTQDSDSDPNIGAYLHDSPYGISITVGGYEFKTDCTQMSGLFGIEIGNDVTSNGTNDYYFVHSDKNAYTNGLWINDISWELRDSTHTAISSTDLPITPPILNAWNYNYFHINGGDNGVGYVNFGIGGTITQATPEPLTCVFLIAGGLALRRRRKTKALD